MDLRESILSTKKTMPIKTQLNKVKRFQFFIYGPVYVMPAKQFRIQHTDRLDRLLYHLPHTHSATATPAIPAANSVRTK